MSRGWDSRVAHGGEFTDEARQVFADLLARRHELPALPATSRMTVCPTKRYGDEYGCDRDVPTMKPHTTCDGQDGHDGICWCWTGCDDPDCDHPACGGRGWRTFQDLWREHGGEVDHYLGGKDRVIVWTTPWLPWIDANPRHSDLLDEAKRGSDTDGAKLLKRLQRGPVYPVKVGQDYVDMEIALFRQGIAMEERWVCETSLVALAYDVASGQTELDSGGTITSELRLAEAVGLETAPAGFQGALF